MCVFRTYIKYPSFEYTVGETMLEYNREMMGDTENEGGSQTASLWLLRILSIPGTQTQGRGKQETLRAPHFYLETFKLWLQKCCSTPTGFQNGIGSCRKIMQRHCSIALTHVEAHKCSGTLNSRHLWP